MKKIAAIALASVIVAGSLAMIEPPSFALDQDEKIIWSHAADEQRNITRSGLIYEDEKLNSYLNGVLTRLLPEGGVPGLKPRVVVIRSRAMNAFTFPDGTIYVHSCMLALMDNEAQLAILLGHEITHAINRHSVKSYRNMKSKFSFLASLSVIGAWAGAGLFGSIGTMAAITGYSRELETEADMGGLALMVKAGYDPAESVTLFNLLEAEAKEESLKEPFFFGNHPRLQERKENCEGFLKSGVKSGGSVNREVFTEAIRNVMLDSAVLELKAGRFKGARAMAEKYRGVWCNDPRAYYVLGEIFRQRAEMGDADLARENYAKAISLDESYVEAYRGLGLISLKLNENADARRYFSEYLVRSPKAADRAYIEEYLKGLN